MFGAVVDDGLVVAADASEDEIVLVVAATIPVKVHRFTAHNIATNRNCALIKTIYLALLLFWLLGCDTRTIALFSSKGQR